MEQISNLLNLLSLAIPVVTLALVILTLMKLYQLSRKEDMLMAAIDDLNAAVAAEAQVLTDVAAATNAAVQAILGHPNLDPAIETAAQAILSNNATLEASAKKLTDAVNPPAPPTT